MSDGDSEKDKGNAAFRREDYATALKHYDRAIETAGSGACAVLFSNKAATLQKLEKYDLSIQQCRKGLAAPGLTPELKSKIHFRITLAYEAQGKFEDAIKAIKNCECSPSVMEKMGDLINQQVGDDPDAMRAFYTKLLQGDHFKGRDTEALTAILDRLIMEGKEKQRNSQMCDHDDDRSMPSRAELISEHNQLLALFKQTFLGQFRGFSVRFDTFSSAAAGDTSTALLFDLKRIGIGQLRLHVINAGRLLIVRTVTEPVMMGALTTLIEDPQDDVTRLSVYNLRPPQTSDVSSLLPMGTCLAIKDPWFKPDAADGKHAIRVDNPANLVYLDKSHDLLKNVNWQTVAPELPSSSSDPKRLETWESFEKRGNELFVAGNFELAVATYSDAIELKRKIAPNEAVVDLLANRAAAYLADDKPMDAYWDCQSALHLKPGHLKATFRLAKAFGKQGKYDQAKEVLEKSPHTTRPGFQAEISRLNRLIREQKHGDYDVKALLKEATASQAPRLDHADYDGGVRVQWISQERGRGLVARRDFALGDLLFVNKAFEATYTSEVFPEADQQSLNDDLHNECVSRIIRRVSKNGELLKTDAGDALAVNARRVAAIVHQNAFSCNYSEAETSVCGRPKIDLPGVGFAFDGCGIWTLLASFMNHSCAPNTVVFYVGDLMIVRAAKRIRRSEELTTSYVCVTSSYEKRQEALKKYGFECRCELCVCDSKRTEEQPDVDGKRQALMDSFNARFSNQLQEAAHYKPNSLAKLTEEVRKLAEEFSSAVAYKNRSDPQLQCLCVAVAFGYNAQQKWLQAAKFNELAFSAAVGKEGIKSDGTFVCNAHPAHVFLHCLNALNNYQTGRDVGKAKEYLGKMRQAAKICWGSDDKELLAMLYPGLPLKDFFDWMN